jgi:hypothetical protein
MKKLILSFMFIVGTMNISNSQNTIEDVYSCVNSHFTNLTQCFELNDVTGRYSGGGNTLYFQPDAGIIYSQLNTCVDNYNKDRVTCPTAPLLILGSSSKKKKIAL